MTKMCMPIVPGCFYGSLSCPAALTMLLAFRTLYYQGERSFPMHLSQLSAQGQIPRPKEIQELLSLTPGDMIAYEVREGTVILKRAEPFDTAFHQALSVTL